MAIDIVTTKWKNKDNFSGTKRRMMELAGVPASEIDKFLIEKEEESVDCDKCKCDPCECKDDDDKKDDKKKDKKDKKDDDKKDDKDDDDAKEEEEVKECACGHEPNKCDCPADCKCSCNTKD